jgi:hypothetical protein
MSLAYRLRLTLGQSPAYTLGQSLVYTLFGSRITTTAAGMEVDYSLRVLVIWR